MTGELGRLHVEPCRGDRPSRTLAALSADDCNAAPSVLRDLVAHRAEQPVADATGAPCTYDHHVGTSGLLDQYLRRVSRNSELFYREVGLVLQHRPDNLAEGVHRRLAGIARVAIGPARVRVNDGRRKRRLGRHDDQGCASVFGFAGGPPERDFTAVRSIDAHDYAPLSVHCFAPCMLIAITPGLVIVITTAASDTPRKRTGDRPGTSC
jgi:hypothetical protein